MQIIDQQYLETLRLDDLWTNGPEEPPGRLEYLIAAMLEAGDPEAPLRHCHERWIWFEFVFIYTEADCDDCEDDGLKYFLDGLCAARDYFIWRRANRHLSSVRPSQPFPGRSDIVPPGLAEAVEPVFQYHDRRGTIDALVSAMPLDTDPLGVNACLRASRPWRDANAAKIDAWREARDSQPVPQEDLDWLTIADVAKLEAKLTADSVAQQILNLSNANLKTHKVGALTMHGVAAIGCVFRKNIRKQNGEVPVVAIEQFFARSNTLGGKRRLHHLQIGAARDILIGCGYMKMVRAASKDRRQCAVYELVEPDNWL